MEALTERLEQALDEKLEELLDGRGRAAVAHIHFERIGRCPVRDAQGRVPGGYSRDEGGIDGRCTDDREDPPIDRMENVISVFGRSTRTCG